MVPYEAEMTVIAVNGKAAIEIACSRFKDAPREYIVCNSEDECAANDWHPLAEEIDRN